MFRLVLCLFFLILRAEANVPETENPVIRLSYNSYDRDGHEHYTVLKDKPLKIIIEDGYARIVWCLNHYPIILEELNIIQTEEFVSITEFSANDDSILNITNVTAEMSTRWVCTVLQEYHGPVRYLHKEHNYTAKYLHFHLHVKGARAVILTANNQNLTYVTPNLSVNYDGKANYTYEDGVDFPVDFSCEKAKDGLESSTPGKKDTLRLEYYNAEGILLFQTKPRVRIPHKFRSVLKSNNDKYYLDCIRAASEPDREYRYRTTFYKTDLHAEAVQHALILSINGQRLSPLSNNDKSYYYDDYIFKYIDGEVLNVTCQKSDLNLRGSLSFYYNKETVHHVSKAFRSQSEAVISVNASALGMESKSLVCSINNMDVAKPNASLLFLSDVPEGTWKGGYGVRIRGLPRNNVLYQYTNYENQWTIEYQYSVNDTLNLTCVSNVAFRSALQWHQYPNPFLWIFRNQTFESAAIEMAGTRIKFSEIPFTKILDATHNGTKIKCIYFPIEKFMTYLDNVNRTVTFEIPDENRRRSVVEIILRLKPELVSEAKLDEDTSGKTSTQSYTLVYCLTAAGLSVIIILVIIFWAVKRTRCCIRSSSQELPSVPAATPNPDNVFYLNLLSVFDDINAREAAELEHHYEEIR